MQQQEPGAWKPSIGTGTRVGRPTGERFSTKRSRQTTGVTQT